MTTARKDSTGKMLLLGIQHVFAMFGSTVLVPALTGLSPSVALLCAGIGTLLFHLVTKGKVPTFLGSSFAFIAAINLVGGLYADGAAFGTPEYYQNALPYATGAILIAGAVYLLFSLLVYFIGTERFLKLFPPVITGPMIIIIGLMLAPTAISSITAPIGDTSVLVNWAVAALTILIIIGVTLFAHGFFKLVPILIGIIGGYLIAWAFGIVDFTAVNEASWISLPKMFLPKFSGTAILAIAPIALVTFVEHIGDITASSAVTGQNFMKDPGLHRTLLGDGLATMFAGLVGGPANTTYSENTGVLAATKNYNPRTLEIAAVFAVCLSFLGKLGALLQTLPGPVMGGVSVVLFGMIAAVGLRTLVENQVDFKRSRNLLIVAVMLVLGLGGVTITFSPTVSLSGTALAALLGILLNVVLPDPIDRETTEK
ncbi:MAG: uracil-xanthine permease family protein [Eubacteriales bacterium]|nr:uracil-xanthine permease family protein [Eubacteriales bacterium]